MCSNEAQELVTLSIDGLSLAARESNPSRRFADAHLAALRAAAAIVASRSQEYPSSFAPRGRVTNVWQLLARSAPELSEWAALFHYSADKRTAVAAGTMAVGTREADDTLRDAATFVARVAALLGLPAERLEACSQWLVVT